jgi:DNA-binding response OmpR family regulator
MTSKSTYPELPVSLAPVEWELLLRFMRNLKSAQMNARCNDMTIEVTRENAGPLHHLMRHSVMPVSFEAMGKAMESGKLNTDDSAVLEALITRLKSQLPA